MSADSGINLSYVNERDVNKTLYIVITADRGLCGGYNANAIKCALDDVESPEKACFLTIGRRANEFFSVRQMEIADKFLYISENPQYIHAIQIAKKAVGLFDSGEVDAVKLVYTSFASSISQVPTLIQLLPIEKPVEKEGEKKALQVVNYEPTPEEVLAYVVPKYLESTIYGALVESSASEQAARRIAMESATDNAGDIIDELALSFNRARQAAITQEITEIVGGAEALK